MSIASLLVLAFLPPLETADVKMAQGTPPLQGSPPSTTTAPAESTPGGTRPTTPAPEPATPTTDTQKEGAKPALPAAPAEKMAPSIEKK